MTEVVRGALLTSISHSAMASGGLSDKSRVYTVQALVRQSI